MAESSYWDSSFLYDPPLDNDNTFARHLAAPVADWEAVASRDVAAVIGRLHLAAVPASGTEVVVEGRRVNFAKDLDLETASSSAYFSSLLVHFLVGFKVLIFCL